MSSHTEHVANFVSKGTTITISAGSTTLASGISGAVLEYQPLVSFLIMVIAGVITMVVGGLTIKEKRELSSMRKKEEIARKLEEKRRVSEHDLFMQRQSLEILNLKKIIEEKEKEK
jgi:hypothetical protein